MAKPRSKLKLTPSKAKAHAYRSDEAWWYDNDNGIDVYVRTLDDATNGAMTLSCFISRRALAAYLR